MSLINRIKIKRATAVVSTLFSMMLLFGYASNTIAETACSSGLASCESACTNTSDSNTTCCLNNTTEITCKEAAEAASSRLRRDRIGAGYINHN